MKYIEKWLQKAAKIVTFQKCKRKWSARNAAEEKVTKCYGEYAR